MSKNDLIDLGFIGPRFTWSHGKNTQQRSSAILDRALLDIAWHQRFSDSKVMHCPHSYSDHCPLLLSTHPYRSDAVGERHFHFEVAWLSDQEVYGIWGGNMEKWHPIT